jgi:hypothetical protein
MENGSFRKKKTYFSQVSNEALRDNTLSLKAKGLYALIQSYITIENFTLYKATLEKQCVEGSSAFNSAWKELKDKGYLTQYKTRTEKGGYSYEYDLLDVKNPHMENRGVDNPPYGKVGVYNNTEPNNTNINNTDIKKTEKINNKGATLAEVAPCAFLFFSLYENTFGRKHPYIKREQIERAEDSISSFLKESCLEGDLEGLKAMIIRYFNSTFSRGTDYNINHFANYETMLHRAQECGYVTME